MPAKSFFGADAPSPPRVSDTAGGPAVLAPFLAALKTILAAWGDLKEALDDNLLPPDERALLSGAFKTVLARRLDAVATTHPLRDDPGFPDVLAALSAWLADPSAGL